MRIKCPECDESLSFGVPKPGSYRPKCKHCGKGFRIKVSDDTPPKVRVGKLKKESSPKPSSDQPTKAKPEKARKVTSAAEATIESSNPGGVDATMGGVDQTMGGVDATMGGVDQTMQNPANATVEATMDSSVGESAVAEKANREKGRGDRTIGGADATMDGTFDGSSASASASSAKPKVSVSAGGSATGKSQAGSSKSGSVSVSGKHQLAKRSSPSASKESSADVEIPEKLGGYKILRLLGRGAMGAVYEAKQVSLDRLVALKTIRGRLAGNPASLARFTREAYAAAQLTHHNVVQIYDFGEDDGRHFFSMEWVRGGPLDDLVHDKGALDPKLAAGYVLQAARGLQFAHRNGMVHRDVKPANLLLSDEGVVKVADLGLVKIPDQMDPESDVGASGMSGMESGTQVTMQGTAVGTPAYMAPEQGVDAAAVDHRADIYSLGCTLFYLLAGKPPFDGSVVSEVLEQHASQPLPDLTQINSRVPAELQQVVQRTMAKRPEDRYGALSEMISDLEAYLGVTTDGKFSPSSEQADQWEAISGRYASATALQRLSKPVLAGLIAVAGLLTVVMPFAGLGWLLVGPVLFVSALFTAILLGSGHSPVAKQTRAWIGSLAWTDYGVALLGLLVFLLVASIAGLWPGIVVGALLGGIAGAAYHFALILPSRKKSEEVVHDAERFIRDLRIDGADEDGVRSFAARYAGKKWQGIFERLFGYESLCKIREQVHGDPSFSGPTSSNSWRDKVCASLMAKSSANREARDHKRLAGIEQRGLQSEGLSAGEARDRAWQMAAAVMDNAKVMAPSSSDADAAAEEKRNRMKAMLADARSGKYKKERDKLAPLKWILGGQTRLLAGCVLLAIFAILGNASGLFDTLKEIDLQKLPSGDFGDVENSLNDAVAKAREGDAETDIVWSIGLAGLLLVMSSFVSGWRMTPFAIAATIVILFGASLGIPGVGVLKPWMVAGLAGIAIYVPGILFGESKES